MKSSLKISQNMIRVARNGLKLLPEECVETLKTFLQNQLHPQGGFRGRAQENDLYYTLFGIECFEILGQPVPFENLIPYLNSFGLGENLDFVHLSCLGRCLSKIKEGRQDKDKLNSIYNQLSYLSQHDDSVSTISQQVWDKPEAGFIQEPSKTLNDVETLYDMSDLMYQNFIMVLTSQDMGKPIPCFEEVTSQLKQLNKAIVQKDNWEKSEMNITPVASAATVLANQLIDKLSPEWQYLLMSRYTHFGGFLAATDAPTPDLLSTATALFALNTMGIPLNTVQEQCLMFIEALWDDEGGFCGHIIDTTADCEYTFYGLLAMGVLADENGT